MSAKGFEDSIAEAMKEQRWGIARELLQKTIASMPPDWCAIREENRQIYGTFWDRDEFMAYVDHFRSQTKKLILWTSPSFSKMYAWLADVNLSEGRSDDALLANEKGLALQPDHPLLWIQKGYLFNRAARHADALAAYRTASTIREWTPASVLARAFRGQGSTLIDLHRLPEAKEAYVRSLQFAESELARKELEGIEQALSRPRKTENPLLWAVNAYRVPPTDPLTIQLLALVDGLESIPGPRTVGPENYSRISKAFFARGWAGFEEAFDAVVPRTRPDYADVKRDLLRESIFNPKVHSRMARVLLGETSVEEIMDEVEKGYPPVVPQ